jgi:hypothetical protein
MSRAKKRWRQFSCWLAPRDLLKGIVNHNMALAPSAQNELTGEATKRRCFARDSALPMMMCTEFYEHGGHGTQLK